jgi:hypothetical protein
VKSASWKRWVEESPAGSLGLVLPKAVCALRPGKAFDDALAGFAASMAPAVGAVILATPPAFSPSAFNREALKRFVGETLAVPDGVAKVWRPSGLWDLATALKTAADAGAVLSWDPFADPTVPPETYEAVAAEAMYWRPAGLGRKGPLSPDHLDRLAALSETSPTAWIVLATAEAWKDAKRVNELVQK